MDQIIFGDNQFFGINHMSEEKAQAQAERFKDLSTVLSVVDAAYDAGIHAFMFNTHDRVGDICNHFRSDPTRYADLRLYPSMPYAHKYANAVTEKGIVGALNEFLFSNRSAGQVLGTLVRGGLSVVNQDLLEVMKLLVDAEMRMFRGLNVRVVFLQNIITDLLLGLRAKAFFIGFKAHLEKAHRVEVGFNTMNLPALLDLLTECGLENPIICSSINKAGYLMNPSREAYEAVLRSNRPVRPMAMSIMASGAVDPREAIEYVSSLGKVESIVFGASSKANILQTKLLIEEAFRGR